MTSSNRPSVLCLCAGTEPLGLNPQASNAMDEVGVDISGHSSTMVDVCLPESCGLVVAVGGHAQETYPVFLQQNPRTGVVHRGFEDPPRHASNASSEDEAMPHYWRVLDASRKFVVTPPALLAEPMPATGVNVQ